MTEKIGNHYERTMIYLWFISCDKTLQKDKYAYVVEQWSKDSRCTPGKCPSLSSVIRYVSKLPNNDICDKRKDSKNEHFITACTPDNEKLMLEVIEQHDGKITKVDLANLTPALQ